MKKINFKSVGAVVAGILVIVILSVATDTVLELLGVFPPPTKGLFVTWMLLLALAYRTVYAFIGGFVTAWLAPHKPMQHVKVLNIIGVILGTLGVIAGWNLSQHWYPISLVLTSAFCVWLGGMVQTKKISISQLLSS